MEAWTEVAGIWPATTPGSTVATALPRTITRRPNAFGPNGFQGVQTSSSVRRPSRQQRRPATRDNAQPRAVDGALTVVMPGWPSATRRTIQPIQWQKLAVPSNHGVRRPAERVAALEMEALPAPVASQTPRNSHPRSRTPCDISETGSLDTVDCEVRRPPSNLAVPSRGHGRPAPQAHDRLTASRSSHI